MKNVEMVAASEKPLVSSSTANRSLGTFSALQLENRLVQLAIALDAGLLGGLT